MHATIIRILNAVFMVKKSILGWTLYRLREINVLIKENWTYHIYKSPNTSFSIPYLWMIMLSENKIKSVTIKYFCKFKFLKCKPNYYYFCWASIPMKVSWETELYFNRNESKFMRPIIIINTSANFGDAVFILLRMLIFCFQSGIDYHIMQ